MAATCTAALMGLVIFLHLGVHCRSEANVPRTSSPSDSLLNSDPAFLFSELDRNGDGTIDLDEFNELFVSVPIDSSPSLSPFSSPSRSVQSSKSMNPSIMPSTTTTMPLSPPFRSPTILPIASQSKPPSPPTPLPSTRRPSAPPSLRPMSNPTTKPSGSQTYLSLQPSVEEPTNLTSAAPMQSPSIFEKSSASPSKGFIVPTASKRPAARPSGVPSVKQLSLAPSLPGQGDGLEFGQVRASTNVTLVSVKGILSTDAKVVFEESSLSLLIDRYPRKDSYEIKFLFVHVEGQVLRYDDGRLLQEADRLGDLTVFLRIAAEVSTTTTIGFDFQLSMNSFFMEHGSSLLDRLEIAGISMRPDSVQGDATDEAKVDKTGGTSIGNYFSPPVIVGISLAMIAVILLGVFITSRSMWPTNASPEDYTMESPTGRLGATPSYDLDNDPDLESVRMPFSKLSRQEGEGQSKAGNSDRTSPPRYPTDYSTGSPGSPAGSHLAGLDVPYPASFASDEEISFAVTSPQKKGDNTTAGEIKRTWARTQRRVNESGTLRALATNMFDDDSTNGARDTGTEGTAPTSESRARQQKRKLEYQLHQSKQRSRDEHLPSFAREDLETGEAVHSDNDFKFRTATRGARKREKGPGQLKVCDDFLVNGSVQSDEMSFGSDIILEVAQQQCVEEKEEYKTETKASPGWFRRGTNSTFGLFNFGRNRRGNPAEVTQITRSTRRGRNPKKSCDCVDDDGDEEPETILLGQAGKNEDGNSPTYDAMDRNRPPRLDLRELFPDSASKVDAQIETPSVNHTVQNSVVGQAELDRYTTTASRGNRCEEEQPLHTVRQFKSESSISHKQADPPTASEHRRALLEILDALSPKSGIERKKASIRRQRRKKVTFREETMTFPVNENSEIVGSIRNDGDNQVELQWGHVI